MMTRLLPPFALLLLVGLTACPASREPASEPPTPSRAMPQDAPIVGGLYASKQEDGSYRVLKVLALDDFAVHLRSYANRFESLPADLDPSTLTLGSIDSGEFGIGHFPLARQGFLSGEHTLLKKTTVEEDELEGYRIYLEAMGGR
ncbi:MAG: hypothetical protein P1V51_16225 [Deltaproteobacteria bacterium]|nr:hypothetical protein [Deltaproteobacteria bacterium]